MAQPISALPPTQIASQFDTTANQIATATPSLAPLAGSLEKSVAGRTHFKVDDAELARLEQDTQAELESLDEELQAAIAADPRLAELTERITAATTRLEYIELARAQRARDCAAAEAADGHAAAA